MNALLEALKASHTPFFSHLVRGLEKESLRIDSHSGRLSQASHPISLGKSLTHSVFTTDFAESQIEIVTPPASPYPKGRYSPYMDPSVVCKSDLHSETK